MSSPLPPSVTPLEQLNAGTSLTIYTDLFVGEIRTVTLIRGEPEDPLRCELAKASLGLGLEYEALSYVWGSQADPGRLLLDGQEFWITRHLEQALLHLRLPDHDLILWVDAICINQSDVQERNMQVRLMHQVYADASQVLLWLGPAGDNSDSVMQLVHDSAAKDFNVDWLVQEDRFFEYVMAQIKLHSREYWSRLWVCQEIAYAKEVLVVCGHSSVTYKELLLLLDGFNQAKCNAKFQSCVSTRGTKLEFGFLDILLEEGGPQSIPNPGRAFKSAKSLNELACLLRTKNCTDPRDKVFVFRNFLADEMQHLITVDYRLKVTNVFISATKAFITATGCLDIISWPKAVQSQARCASGYYEHSKLPSWVADWSSGEGPTSYTLWLKESRSNHHEAYFSFSGQQVLHAKGLQLGRITKIQRSSILDCGSNGHSNSLDMITMVFYLVTCLSLFEREVWKEIWPDFLETITVGQLYRPPGITASFLPSLLKKCTHRTNDRPDFTQYEIDLLLTFRSWHAQRAFFLFDEELEEGDRMNMGMGSTCAVEGDLICVLLGCRVPVILRSVQYKRYIVVGDAYVPNWMGGDRLDYAGVSEDLKDFYLC